MMNIFCDSDECSFALVSFFDLHLLPLNYEGKAQNESVSCNVTSSIKFFQSINSCVFGDVTCYVLSIHSEHHNRFD